MPSIRSTEHTIGRAGLILPTYEHLTNDGGENMRRFLQLFRGIWELNTGSKHWEIEPTPNGVGKEPKQETLWIPRFGEKPLVCLTYTYTPAPGYASPRETHTVLQSPSTVASKLKPVIEVAFSSSYNAGYLGARDSLHITDQTGVNHFSIYDSKDMFYAYTPEDLANQELLTQKASQVVELLS